MPLLHLRFLALCKVAGEHQQKTEQIFNKGLYALPNCVSFGEDRKDFPCFLSV